MSVLGKISYDPTGVMLGLFGCLSELKSKFVAQASKEASISRIWADLEMSTAFSARFFLLIRVELIVIHTPNNEKMVHTGLQSNWVGWFPLDL